MAILRIDAVLQETGERSKTSIYNRVKEGVFTKSVPIGQRAERFKMLAQGVGQVGG